MCVHSYVCLSVSLSVCLSVWMWVYKYTMYKSMYVSMYVHIYMCMCVPTYVHIYVHMCILWVCRIYEFMQRYEHGWYVYLYIHTWVLLFNSAFSLDCIRFLKDDQKQWELCLEHTIFTVGKLKVLVCRLVCLCQIVCIISSLVDKLIMFICYCTWQNTAFCGYF